ncbi:MAG: dihydropyrimidinase [Bacteroidota bacterium]
MSILIKNGCVITTDGEISADVFIENETIKRIEPNLDMKADRIINAAGKLVIPGGIDVHTHLSLPLNNTMSSDNFETGTRAAAFGGTTTIIDFAQQSKGHSLYEALDIRLRQAEKSVIDYGLHMIIVDLPKRRIVEINDMMKKGVTSFKLFTAYPDRLMVDDDTILRTLEQTKNDGGLVCVHAEDSTLIDSLVKQALTDGKTAPKYHATTRPAGAEAKAVKHVIELAHQLNAPVYFVHISCSDSLEYIRQAQSKGQSIYAETCPQYLFTSIEDLDRPNFEGAKYVFTPPPREKWNQEKLWEGLENNSLQVVSTDHCPFNFRGDKELGRKDFTKIPNGAPGIENRLQLLYYFGVESGKISINQWVEIVSTTPAKLFGLYPKKGIIAIGSDADIVIWNPKTEHTISASTHHMNVDYSLYEGWLIRGLAELVISRGDIIIENGKWEGNSKRGKFCVRKIFQNSSS